MFIQPFFISVIMEILENVYYNEKSPFRLTFSTIRAINEYGLTTVYFNYPELFDMYFFLKTLFLQLIASYRYLMVTTDCFWYNRGVYLLDGIGHRIQSRCINEERK